MAHNSSRERTHAIGKARELLTLDAIVLDTETTGLDENAEIVEISLLSMSGRVLLDSLVKPRTTIPPEATEVHGIGMEMVQDAPSFNELWEAGLDTILTSRPLTIYNAEYDLRLLEQTCRISGITPAKKIEAECAMKLYADFRGIRDERYGEFKWHSLASAARQCGLRLPEDLHRSLADIRLTREVLLHIAGSEGKQLDLI